MGVATGISLKPAASAATLTRHPETLNLKSAGQQRHFKLDYAPHFGMFRNSAGEELLDQIRFMHDQGFRSLEDNSMRERTTGDQEAIGGLLEQLDMRMGVFVANSNGFGVPSFTSGDEEHRAQFLADCHDSVEVAKRVNAKWMTVVAGDLSPRLEMDYQTANAIESLRRAADIFEPHGLIMVLEPLNPYADHPGMFLAKIPHAYMICRAVDSRSFSTFITSRLPKGTCFPILIWPGTKLPTFRLETHQAATNQPLARSTTKTFSGTSTAKVTTAS